MIYLIISGLLRLATLLSLSEEAGIQRLGSDLDAIWKVRLCSSLISGLISLVLMRNTSSFEILFNPESLPRLVSQCFILSKPLLNQSGLSFNLNSINLKACFIYLTYIVLPSTVSCHCNFFKSWQRIIQFPEFHSFSLGGIEWNQQNDQQISGLLGPGSSRQHQSNREIPDLEANSGPTPSFHHLQLSSGEPRWWGSWKW